MTRAGSSRPVVVKFGGAALSDPAAVVAHVRGLRSRHPSVVVVVSAREGVTDGLLRALSQRGEPGVLLRTLARIRRRHPRLGPSGERHLAELERALRGSIPPGPARTDRVLAIGERLAVDWIVDELRRSGTRSVSVDAARLGLWTDGRHGCATIDLRRSRRPVRAVLRQILATGTVAVVPGFFGRGVRGEPVTLGRGGSDYSASAIASLLGSPFVELVKRDASVLSADPAIVPFPRTIPVLTYSEAEELAEFGARVLHPMTVEPARHAGVEIRVRSLRSPGSRTVIGAGRGHAAGVRAVTSSPVVRLLRLRFPGARARPGVLAELCALLARAGVTVVHAFTSAAVVSLVVEARHVDAAIPVLERTVARRGGRLEPAVPVVVIAVVGSGSMRALPRFPAAVLAESLGLSATPVSVTLAVPARSGPSAVRALHAALLEPGRTPSRRRAASRRPFAPRPGRPTGPVPS